MSALLRQTIYSYWGCSILSFFFLSPFPPKFALTSPHWKQAWSNWNLVQCAEWSQFVVDYFSIIWHTFLGLSTHRTFLTMANSGHQCAAAAVCCQYRLFIGLWLLADDVMTSQQICCSCLVDDVWFFGAAGIFCDLSWRELCGSFSVACYMSLMQSFLSLETLKLCFCCRTTAMSVLFFAVFDWLRINKLAVLRQLHFLCVHVIVKALRISTSKELLSQRLMYRFSEL